MKVSRSGSVRLAHGAMQVAMAAFTAALWPTASGAMAGAAPAREASREPVREPMRDPMRPPAAALPRADSGGALASPALPPAVRQLLVVDGRRYVVDGTRRRGVGDTLGDARIERIDDDAVLLRRGGELLRLPLFAGVNRRATRDDGTPSGTAASTPATSPSPARRPQPAVQRP